MRLVLAVCCTVLQCAAVCWNVSQCVVCSSVLQCDCVQCCCGMLVGLISAHAVSHVTHMNESRYTHQQALSWIHIQTIRGMCGVGGMCDVGKCVCVGVCCLHFDVLVCLCGCIFSLSVCL